MRTNEHGPYQVVEKAKFPMQLPFHLPLEEVRTYLKQLKVSLQDIYDLFGVTETEIARELLALSPREYLFIREPIAETADFSDFYGINVEETGKGCLEDVDVFTEQTGLSRAELNQLLFLDLSDSEVQAGASRLFFINNTGDQTGHLWIEESSEPELFTINESLGAELDDHRLPDELRDKFKSLEQGEEKQPIFPSEDSKVLVDARG